jgi:hypothetical protein
VTPCTVSHKTCHTSGILWIEIRCSRAPDRNKPTQRNNSGGKCSMLFWHASSVMDAFLNTTPCPHVVDGLSWWQSRFEALMDQFEADDSVWVGIIESSHPTVRCFIFQSTPQSPRQSPRCCLISESTHTFPGQAVFPANLQVDARHPNLCISYQRFHSTLSPIFGLLAVSFHTAVAAAAPANSSVLC